MAEHFVKIKLKPFRVPNFVVVDVGGEDKSYPLKELDAETLDAMCAEFKQEVFKKAGLKLVVKRHG